MPPKDLAPQTPIPTVYKMIATVMLQSGIELGFGLGRNSQGIVESIQVLIKGARHRLGCIPTDDDEKTKKMKDQALSKPIPHLYQSSAVRENGKQEDLGEGICGLFEEIDAIIEEEIELTGFRDAEPREML